MNYPIRKYDGNGNVIYFKDSDGYWSKREYDGNGNKIYFENSSGEIKGKPSYSSLLLISAKEMEI